MLGGIVQLPDVGGYRSPPESKGRPGSLSLLHSVPGRVWLLQGALKPYTGSNGFMLAEGKIHRLAGRTVYRTRIQVGRKLIAQFSHFI